MGIEPYMQPYYLQVANFFNFTNPDRMAFGVAWIVK